jgi:hypothetical protein
MAKFNGYPSNFVERIIYKKLDKLYQFNETNNQIQQIPDQNKKYKYIEIPYIGRPSYAFAKKLKSIIIKNDPTSDLRVIYQTTNPTKRYFPSKDPVNIYQKAGVIYQINCSNFNKTYIGKTIRQLYRRLCEHEKDVTKATISIQKSLSRTPPINKIKQQNKKVINGRIVKKTSTQTLRRSSRLMKKQAQSRSQTQQKQNDIFLYKPNSALGKHVKNTSHSIDFQNPLILNQDQKNYRLLIKESIKIRSRKPILNGTDTSVPLYVFPEGYRKSSYQTRQS